MKKNIILFLIIILLTGCSVKEKIYINKDLSVKEEISMSGTKQFFDTRYKMLPINVIKDILYSNDRNKILEQNLYEYKIETTSNYPSVIAKKTYANLNNFTETTIFKKQYFNNFKVISNDNLITISATDYIKYEQGDLERYPISSCMISIKIPFVAIDNNADKYDARTNTYSWYINDKTNDKEIKLTFDKTKIYIYNLVLYISILIVIILIIIGIRFIFKIKNQNKKVNRI